MMGVVDSVNITIFDIAGHAVHSTTLAGAPSCCTSDNQYYYDYHWTTHKASGVYTVLIEGRAPGGTRIKARTKVAVIK
jgi:hypothetical protein